MATARTSSDNDIAVAIACYNQSRFLSDAIESALAQTLPPSEVIVIDDGSTDKTAAVARRFSTITYVWQNNAGLSAARNAALVRASSQRILFLDADDVLAPEALWLASDRFARTGALAFVYGGYTEVDERRRHLSTHLATEHADGFAALLRGNHIAMHGTVLYDRTLLLGAGGFDHSLPSCEDYDVYLRLSRHHPIGAYAGVGAEYRRHGKTMSRQSLRMVATARKVIDRHATAQDITPEQRAAGRAGKVFMTGYYGETISAELRRAWEGGWLGSATKALLSAARLHPVAFAQVLPSVIAALRRPQR